MEVAWMMDVTLKAFHSLSSVVLLSLSPFGLCQPFQSSLNGKDCHYPTFVQTEGWIIKWEYREIYLKGKLTNQRC